MTDEELIDIIREDVFQCILKSAALQHHRNLQADIRPHFEAILNAIDGLKSTGKGR